MPIDHLSRRHFLQVGSAGLVTASMHEWHRPAASSSAGLGLSTPSLSVHAMDATGAARAVSGPDDSVGAAASAIAPSLQPPAATGRPMPELEKELPTAPDERIGFAVVGLGDFAINQILPSIAQTRFCKLTAVVSGNAEKARTIARAYGVPPASVYSYDTFDRIRENASVQVVYIILPNALHRDWTVRAAGLGKHVFCEKPMAPTTADCQTMIDACARAGRKLGIGYRAPFEPHNKEAARMIRAGEIGKVHTIAGEHGRTLELSKPADQWRAQRALAGGGSLYDIGIYNVNGACFLLGEDPVEVTASWRAADDPDPRIDVETGIEWTMRFPSGARAGFHSGYNHFDTKRMTIMGTSATLELDPATDYEGNRLFVRRKEGTEEKKIMGPTQFVGELDAFAESVKGDREPPYGGTIGKRDVHILESIYEAARTGRAVRV